MTDNIWTARSATKDVALTEIGRIELPKTAEGRYNHDDATIYERAIFRTLKTMLHPGNPNGMSGLLDGDASELGKVKSTDSVTWKQVISMEKQRAAAGKRRITFLKSP